MTRATETALQTLLTWDRGVEGDVVAGGHCSRTLLVDQTAANNESAQRKLLTRGADSVPICIPSYECSVGGWRRLEAYLGISDLVQNLMSSTSLGGWRSDLPKLNKSESGSSCRWGVSPTGESIPQVEAADLTQAETSFTDGREAESALQQSSNNLQTLSERPSLIAFAGFRGFSPPKTLKTTSEPTILPYGNDPMRT